MTQRSSFRIKFTDPDGAWWTAAIGDWTEVCLLAQSLAQAGREAEVVVDHRALAAEVDGYFAGVLKEQQLTGKPQLGQMTSGCSCEECRRKRRPINIVRVPTAKPQFAPVVGGFPLLDAEPATFIGMEAGHEDEHWRAVEKALARPDDVGTRTDPAPGAMLAPPAEAIHSWSAVGPWPPMTVGVALCALWDALVALVVPQGKEQS